jgi:hypothetical protein
VTDYLMKSLSGLPSPLTVADDRRRLQNELPLLEQLPGAEPQQIRARQIETIALAPLRRPRVKRSTKIIRHPNGDV